MILQCEMIIQKILKVSKSFKNFYFYSHIDLKYSAGI